MTRRDEMRGCLSREGLGSLAIRIAQDAGDPGAPGEGSPEYLSVDLFSPDEEEIRQHLESCPSCRKKLLEEVYSARRYLDGLENPENIKRFEKLMGSVEDQDRQIESDYIETILVYDAYDQGEGMVPLAADSEPDFTPPMRFCSEDGTMIIREFQESGSAQPKYMLIVEAPSLSDDAEVIIGEQSFRISPEGWLELKDLAIEITESTIFRIRSRRK